MTGCIRDTSKGTALGTGESFLVALYSVDHLHLVPLW